MEGVKIMRVTTQENVNLEILYEDGYYTVSKVSISNPKTKGEQSSEVLEVKEYKRSLKTYPDVTGLVQRLNDWSYPITDGDKLSDQLKREANIGRAIDKRLRKELKDKQ